VVDVWAGLDRSPVSPVVAPAGDNASMARSLVTVDLAAIRHNAGRLRELLTGAELWAVVKADAYGHGVGGVAPAALAGGASALCVATVGEALALRRIVPTARIVVLGPSHPDEHRAAREAGLELVVTAEAAPVGLPCTSSSTRGWAGACELARRAATCRAMTHPPARQRSAFSRLQLERFLGRPPITPTSSAMRPTALRRSASGARLDAARCGIALYGIDPFEDAAHHGLRPALRWESEVACGRAACGESTGYGCRFVATAPTTTAPSRRVRRRLHP
jgi:alanine racemase